MYLHRSIEINLTQGNSYKLDKPSKMFNRLKASLTGGMTPAEKCRSEVMLCVLQRVNKALRRSNISSLVEISLNEEKIYYAAHGHKTDLKQSITSFIDSKEAGEVSSFKHLHIITEHSQDDIQYVFDISVRKNAPKGHAPVMINVSGFINDYKLNSSTSSDDVKQRIKRKLQTDLDTSQKLKDYRNTYLKQFNRYTDKLITELNQLFPKGCTCLSGRAHTIKASQANSLNKKLGGHFGPSIAYLHFWHFDDIGYQKKSEVYDELAGQDLDYLDEQVDETNSDTQSSWTDFFSSDGDSSSWFGDSSCSGSSCGGGCGGGCGS